MPTASRGDKKDAKIYDAIQTDNAIDGVIITKEAFKVISHYTYNPSYGGGDFGGSSSNNNKILNQERN